MNMKGKMTSLAPLAPDLPLTDRFEIQITDRPKKSCCQRFCCCFYPKKHKRLPTRLDGDYKVHITVKQIRQENESLGLHNGLH